MDIVILGCLWAFQYCSDVFPVFVGEKEALLLALIKVDIYISDPGRCRFLVESLRRNSFYIDYDLIL
jgi:hypothetical protein